MACHLVSLPMEITDMVTEPLNLADLSSLRLTCRTLNSRIIRIFGARYLDTFKTDLSPQGLRDLRVISKTEHLRSHVQRLLIRCMMNYPGEGANRNEEHNGDRLEIAYQAVRESITGGLSACQDFIISSRGHNDPYCEADNLSPGEAMAPLWTIFTECRIEVKGFTLNLRESWLTDHDVGRMQMCRLWASGFMNAWASLQLLCLKLSLTTTSVQTVLDLVLSAVNVRSLMLLFDFEDTQKFLMGLRTSAHQLRRVESLKFHRVRASTNLFIGVISSLGTNLRAFELTDIDLGVGSSWSEFFHQLPRICPLLWTVYLRSLRIGRGGSSYFTLVFPTLAAFTPVCGTRSSTHLDGGYSEDVVI